MSNLMKLTGNSYSALVSAGILAAIAGAIPFTADAPQHGMPPAADPFADITIAARSVFVLDLATGETLYAKNEHEQLPLASLTKIATALVASAQLRNTPVVITSESVGAEGESGLLTGETFTASNLISATLIASINDGAVALSEAAGTGMERNAGQDPREIFVREMNRLSSDRGLDSILFINESGLDETVVTPGAYGSAHDVASLLSFAVKEKPRLLRNTRLLTIEIRSDSNRPIALSNTNPGIASLSGALASKTGSTDLAGGNLAIVFDAGIEHPIAVVVLGSTPEKRFSDVDALVRATRKLFNNRLSPRERYTTQHTGQKSHDY